VGQTWDDTGDLLTRDLGLGQDPSTVDQPQKWMISETKHHLLLWIPQELQAVKRQKQEAVEKEAMGGEDILRPCFFLGGEKMAAPQTQTGKYSD